MEKFLEKISNGIFYLKRKPKKLFILFFLPVFILSMINFIDFFLIPKHKETDQIISYAIQYRSHRYGKTKTGYRFNTAKGYSFSTSEVFIRSIDIDLERTLIFKTVTNVKTEKVDFTEYLRSNLNGIMKYFHFVFLISLIISLYLFITDKPISENTYLNIMTFNPILFVLLLYMFLLY